MHKKFVIAALLSLLASGAAQASQETTGYATYIFGMQNGAVLFIQSGTDRTALPSCGNSNPTRWGINAINSAGQEQLSILLTAKALNKSIQVFGAGTCNAWGDTEDVNYIVMNQ